MAGTPGLEDDFPFQRGDFQIAVVSFQGSTCMFTRYDWKTGRQTVDGSEIRRSPVEVGSLSFYLQGFNNIPGGDRRISKPSTVGILMFMACSNSHTTG